MGKTAIKQCILLLMIPSVFCDWAYGSNHSVSAALKNDSPHKIELQATGGVLSNSLSNGPTESTSTIDNIANSQLWGSGRLLLTGGVASVDGSAGGGISTWALISGYGTEDQIGGVIHSTQLSLSDFQARTQGVSIGFMNRIELSFSTLIFDTQRVGSQLGLNDGFTFEQKSVGLKVRVIGEAVLAQDDWLPQVSIGLLNKKNNRKNVLKAIGADRAQDQEYYLALSKLHLPSALLVNATLKYTRANQNGILGFGGDSGRQRTLEREVSLAYLLNQNMVIGIEYKTQPDNLNFSRQDDWQDVFFAYAPNKHFSFVLAYASLGTVAMQPSQSGLYASFSLSL